MKKMILIAVVLVVAASSALAQIPVLKVRAQVPFDFIVGERMMPSGTYTFTQKQPQSPLVVRHETGKSALILTIPVDKTWTGEQQVSFRNVGDTYFLAGISDPATGVQRVRQAKRYRQAVERASARTVTLAAK